ncbi:hypothetical protein [Leucobacter manosquensis]|uniref:Uncharacterized protein n=1 Tax=Leucobacter manosquensis TaxID=2810611 RepID=A0ABS5M6Q5_9MICO|nr:hypothetical protein [Leucobacter manosquensis]MBS3182869.1 hypothetical protein [Leucobacter manosquensis]
MNEKIEELPEQVLRDQGPRVTGAAEHIVIAPDHGATDEAVVHKKRKLLLGLWSAAAAIVIAVIAGLLLISINKASDVALPEGFPTSQQLPIADGERVAANDPDGNLMSVTVQVASAEAQQQAVTDLQEAGFRIEGRTGSGAIGSVVSLSNEELAVRMSFSHSEDAGYRVKYQIAQR